MDRAAPRNRNVDGGGAQVGRADGVVPSNAGPTCIGVVRHEPHIRVTDPGNQLPQQIRRGAGGKLNNGVIRSAGVVVGIVRRTASGVGSDAQAPAPVR